MIVPIAEVQLMVNWLNPNKEETAVLNSLHTQAEGLVKQYIGYDPVQKTHTEFYPRHLPAGGPGVRRPGVWDVNAARSHAVLESVSSITRTLQLHHIPVRAVTEVKVDYQGKHGNDGNSFGDSTVWTQPDDYWPEDEEENLCMSGQLMTNRGWPLDPGTIKVTYQAGYSFAELSGRAATTSFSGGIYTNEGLDASGIKRAVILTVTHAVHTWQAFKRTQGGQFIPGGLKSERLQDYSYTLSDAASAQATGMLTGLPTEAIEALDPYRHWGILRL